MNAIERVEAQHAELEDLFHEMSAARDADTKRVILEDIAAALAQIPTSRPNVDRLLAELRWRSVTDRTFDANVLTLQEELEREMDEREAAFVGGPSTPGAAFELAAAAA